MNSTLFAAPLALSIAVAVVALANPKQPLQVVYPPSQHETTADRIFLIGTAPPAGPVLVNGKSITRSAAGHFAPSFPLKPGRNQFTLEYGTETLTLTVTRLSDKPEVAVGSSFVKNSLTPAVNVARLPNEVLCFGAIAPTGASLSVKLANQIIPLQPEKQQVDLPANSAVLTQQNQPTPASNPGYYRGCMQTGTPGQLGQPEFRLTQGSKTYTESGSGVVTILSPLKLEIAEVTSDSGTTRTGPSTDYSRMTPLSKGTRAAITGWEGDWLRLDYGVWIHRRDVQTSPGTGSVTSIIRSIKARQASNWTEIVFPLQAPIPAAIDQGDRVFTLTLYNTTAQTDTIHLDDDPLIERLDWQQAQPGQVKYRFHLKTAQQWGYKLRYEGTSLILSLKHPPKLQGQSPAQGKQSSRAASPLTGITIAIDAGHGGPEDLGARGPTGYPEKDVALTISKLVQAELRQRGATVVMTREQDVDLPLQDRIAKINQTEPTIALSLHYNALPDNGDAINTAGIGAFWYHPQAHSLAVYLHNYLTQRLNRQSYGVFWNNLALTRPSVTPAVLMELGFMINPTEFEWIIDSQQQKQLAVAIADGVTEWLYSNK